MTKYELEQSDKTIIKAGRTAYMMGVLNSGNPYRKNQKMAKLWGIGYRQAKNLDEKRRLPNGRFRAYYEPIVENPVCVKCNNSIVAQKDVEQSYCNKCGDWYFHTEFEVKDGKTKKA